jgi:coenzyme F420-reducing hydrogenase delta subunit
MNMAKSKSSKKKDQLTTVLVFSCPWCLPGEELAEGLCDGARIEHIQVMCSGRVDAGFVMKAFEKGADGVLVVGCPSGECHYVLGNQIAEQGFQRVHNMMHVLGMNENRARLELVGDTRDRKLADVVSSFVDEVTDLGPNLARMTAQGE